MNSLPSLTDRRLLRPIAVAVLVSCVSCALLAGRVASTQQLRHVYLVWNLALAWLPLSCAFAVCWRNGRDGKWNWWLTAVAVVWLLFFPNAPYICTDLIHLGPRSHGLFWLDLILILLFALTGLVLGFLSLFLMQTLVARRWGWLAGWGFAAAVSALAGFGIFLGRFRRWNSWDVLLHPFSFFGDLFHWLVTFLHRPTSGIIPLLFAVFVLLAYLMFYALTSLPTGRASPALESACDQPGARGFNAGASDARDPDEPES